MSLPALSYARPSQIIRLTPLTRASLLLAAASAVGLFWEVSGLPRLQSFVGTWPRPVWYYAAVASQYILVLTLFFAAYYFLCNVSRQPDSSPWHRKTWLCLAVLGLFAFFQLTTLIITPWANYSFQHLLSSGYWTLVSCLITLLNAASLLPKIALSVAAILLLRHVAAHIHNRPLATVATFGLSAFILTLTCLFALTTLLLALNITHPSNPGSLLNLRACIRSTLLASLLLNLATWSTIALLSSLAKSKST